ncbi:hypothetical protein OHS59_21005 [Streptomyces sp. NBC_00414]|uniref:DUF6941 family protein n=1 Tax=Streptomyces sp. NBC_00414 TaxID=2975739 RepID=UPI002E1E7B9E
MDVTLSLAQAANIDVSGHLNALGLSWEIIGPSPLPAFVVVAVVRVPPDQSKQALRAELRLVDASGQDVTLGDGSERKMLIQDTITVPPASERPAGLSGGAAMIVEMSAGLVLDPGLYEWILTVSGESRPEWRRRFYVRAKADEYPPRLRLTGRTLAERSVGDAE